MATDVTMPKMGFDMEEGKLVRWLKKVGDPVSQGEPIAEIETDKAVVEVEAFGSGVLSSIVVNEGTIVPVGELLGVIGAPGEQVAAPAGRAAAPPPAAPEPPRTAETRTLGVGEAYPLPVEPTVADRSRGVNAELPGSTRNQAATPDLPRSAGSEANPAAAAAVRVPVESENGSSGSGDGRLRVSPIAQRIALEHGVDLRQIRGTGPEGRIVKNDVLAYVDQLQKGGAPAPVAAPAAPATAPAAMPAAAAAPAAPAPAAPAPAPAPRPAAGGDPYPIEMSQMRKAIAKRMANAKSDVPHFYLTVDVDMEATLAFREQVNQDLGGSVKVSVNDFIVLAVARATAANPQVNRFWLNDGIYQAPAINVAVAVALEDGLIVPCVFDTDRKGLVQIARETRSMAERARSNQLTPQEISNGTIAISNLGMYDIDRFEAIINPPQSTIVAVGKVKDVPVVKDGQVVPGKVLEVTGSFDHRVLDGAQAAVFMRDLKQRLENPLKMML